MDDEYLYAFRGSLRIKAEDLERAEKRLAEMRQQLVEQAERPEQAG